MSKIADMIRAYVKGGYDGEHYGSWGALRIDQRRKIRELCDTCDTFEKTADEFCRRNKELAREIFEEIERVAMSKIDENAPISTLDDTVYIKAIDEVREKYTGGE